MRPKADIQRKILANEKDFLFAGTMREENWFKSCIREPVATQEATDRVSKILDAECTAADLPDIAETQCKHLAVLQRRQLL